MEDRTAATLQSLILRYVIENTKLSTDLWATYNGIHNHYNHLSHIGINHSLT